MALADLKKMETAVWKVIEKSSGALRVKTSNRKTHIIACGTKMLREECDKQMAAREGYKDKAKFKKGLKKRFGDDKPILNHMITLDGCSKFGNADATTEIVSFNNKRYGKLKLGYRSMIKVLDGLKKKKFRKGTAISVNK